MKLFLSVLALLCYVQTITAFSLSPAASIVVAPRSPASAISSTRHNDSFFWSLKLKSGPFNVCMGYT